jgi:hypothetical protein
VTELAGPGLSAGDRRAGRAAWLLCNTQGLDVYSVHSLFWHEVDGRFSSPILDQVGRAVGLKSELSVDDHQLLGRSSSVLDVLGVKHDEVWLVQSVWVKNVVDSALTRTLSGVSRLFRGPVFDKPVLKGDSVSTLYQAFDVIKKAFPTAHVRVIGLASDPDGPDFELYEVDVPKKRPESLVMKSDRIICNSIDYADVIREDAERLWMLPERLDNDLFKGIPPCRGGRTLGILGALAKRQLQHDSLLTWRQRDVINVLRDDFDYETPRDKVRHDLDDRLVSQGFMRKWGSDYFLTVRGIARYHYCLAKYTSVGTLDPMEVLESCRLQREKVVAQFGYV